MSVLPHTTALLIYLKSKNDIYYGKLLELREEVERWLAYVPQTFPHYTRHTVQHSDEIVLQASKLLFRDDDPSRPIIPLSAVEVYALAASAYLHDAGMVSADAEKLQILKSNEWNEWISQGSGAKRWRDVQALRRAAQPSDETERHFIADVQTRFLVAEFIRRIHHIRAADVIRQHQHALGRFAFDDLVLQRTISDICVGHGLRPQELEDDETYPDRRDIRGEPVNVRLIAILLRLADLLDMSNDRACPLLLSAACPLPADSLAHWTQYQRITHRLTAPDKIDITAECHTQTEHRILQDWCQWIVEEVRNARAVMARTARHRDWRPPRCGFDPPDDTIRIRPAAAARYIPSKWTFELDPDAVFERLILDVYEQPLSFVRELLQNALDATRCQMYAELQNEMTDPPQYPTQVDEVRRRRYPLLVSLGQIEIDSPLSGERELRQVLTIEDCGLGMDTDIIKRYFLQVGRSYYVTDDFRRNYRFVPASRFGVGFLSVFAVSDQVLVETYKPTSSGDGGAISLTLTGPRNYLLTEKSLRRIRGTRIAVLLREPMAQGELTRWMSYWCRRVEFPVRVDDLGVTTEVLAETPEQFIYERPDITEQGAKFVVRSFPVNRPGIEGEFYVFARVDSKGESWAAWSWARHRYPEMHPEASAPPFPSDLTCVHGITVQEGHYPESMSVRMDYRNESYLPVLGRGARRAHSRGYGDRLDPALASRWSEIIAEHLRTSEWARGDDAWLYKQRLVSIFPFAEDFWASLSGTIRIYEDGRPRFVSLRDLERLPTLGVMMHLKAPWEDEAETPEVGPPPLTDLPVFLNVDIQRLSHTHRQAIFSQRDVREVRCLADNVLVVNWALREGEEVLFAGTKERPILLAELADSALVGGAIHKTTGRTYACCLLNTGSPLVQWLIRAKEACAGCRHGLTASHFERLISLLVTPLSYAGHELTRFTNYLDGWREMKGLPLDLAPPPVHLERRAFSLWRLRSGTADRRD